MLMSLQKTLLIVGAGYEQLPAIQIAKAKGLWVLVTDLNPQAPGVEYADVFAQISTADKDANLAFAKANDIDGVMTLGSELAVPVVAHICETLHLPGLSKEVALKATNKNFMHQAFEAHAVSAPRAKKIVRMASLNEFIAECGWPVVIKPSDSSGQKGVGIFHQADKLQAALDEAISFSTDGAAIVEEYISGPEINVTAVVEAGNIHFLSFSHRVTAEPPHFGIAIEHRFPIGIDSALLEEVKITALKAIESIGLKDGIAYPQIIASPEKGAKILEIAARIPGGYMREMALLQSGVDMIEVVIDQAIGQFTTFKDYQKYPRYDSVMIKFLTELNVPGIKTISQVRGFIGRQTDQPGIFLSECRLSEGQVVPDLTSSSARFGAIITYGDSIVASQALLDQTLQSVVLK
jgi:biotin carboxylase